MSKLGESDTPLAYSFTSSCWIEDPLILLDITESRMKDLKRSIRRHHLARIKTKFRKKTRSYGRLRIKEDFDMPTYIGILTRTPKQCSCLVCGNSRKYEGYKFTDKSLFQLLKKEGC